jgi:molybdopterin converting factor small subunit
MPVVKIPAPYRGPTGGADRVEVEGATVRECIQAVADQFPGFGNQVWDTSCRVHRFVKLYVNGDEIDRQATETPVVPSDEVEVLAAVAGG